MSEETTEKTETKKRSVSKWIWRIIKISIFLAIFLFIILTVLSRLGGNSEILKGGLEDVLSDNTSYDAKIGRLSAMHFFPNVIVDMQEIHFYTKPVPVEPENEENEEGEAETDETEAGKVEKPVPEPKAVIRVSDVKFVIGFFDALFRPGRIKDLQIRGIYADSGTFLDKPVVVDSFLVDEFDKDKFALDLLGKIGDTPLSIAMDLAYKGEGFSRVFILEDKRGVRASIGDLSMDAVFVDAFGDSFRFENINLNNKDTKVLRGNLSFDPSGDEQMKISGQLRINPGTSHLDPDVLIDWGKEPLAISGSIEGDQLEISDFNAQSPFMRSIDALDRVFGSGKKSAKIDLSPVQLDLDVDFKAVRSKALQLGSVQSEVVLKESKMLIGPLSGKIFQGDLSGEVSLSAAASPATLKKKILIKGLDYGFIQKQFKENAEIEGKADLGVNLESTGQSLDALIDGLSGRVDFVGGQAQMRSGLLEFWGGGLLNALMPKLGEDEKLNVNCVVVNMDIENLKGHSDAVFVDTERVTLNGEGTYDFKGDKMDIVLDPKSKGVSVGDISAAVNITGPLDDLAVSPNMLDLGKRVGGILLGAVNPAFYALSVADLGLRDNHPCSKFIIQKEALPPPEDKAKEGDAKFSAEEQTPETENLND